MSVKSYFNIFITPLILLSMLLSAPSCQRKKVNHLSPLQYYNNNILPHFNNIPCSTVGTGYESPSYGSQRVSYYLKALGAYRNGYFTVNQGSSPMIPLGSGPTVGDRSFIGISPVGDIVTVHPQGGGIAHVALHLCVDGYVIPNRQLIQANVTGSFVLKSRPDCSVDEVSALDLGIMLGAYGHLQARGAPLAFASFSGHEAIFCNNSAFSY